MSAAPTLTNPVRCRRLIDQAMADLQLDLSGLTVLTEAATGNFVLTPLLAVLGTNERDPRIDMFGYVGPLAVKLAMELDIEVRHAKTVIVGGGHFGASTVEAFGALGAAIVHVQPASGESLGDARVRRELATSDLLVFVEHENRALLVGPGGQLEATALREINPGLAIVHLTGNVAEAALRQTGLPCRPERLAPPGKMSVVLDYLGPKTVVDLCGAGLKVGQALAEGMRLHGDAQQAIAYALAHSPAMDF